MTHAAHTEGSGPRLRREWIYYGLIAVWILAIQVWIGPRIRDYELDNSFTLQSISGRLIQLPRADADDLYQHRASEIRSQLLAPLSRPDPVGTWQVLAKTEDHPPLYFWLLQLWVIIFGNRPPSWFAFSALQMVLAGMLLYRLGRKELDPIPALLAPLCLGASLPILNQSQSVRHYLLALLLTEAALLLAYPAARPATRGTRFHWLWLGLALAAGLATHYLFALVIAGINLAVWPGLWKEPRERWRQWIGSQVFAAIWFAPFLTLFLTQLRRVETRELLSPAGSVLHGVYSAYLTYFFQYAGQLTLPLALALGLSLAAYVVRRPGALLRFHLGLTLTGFGLYAGLIQAGLIRYPYALMPRFFMAVAPVVLLLPALTAGRMPGKWLKAAVVMLLPALMLLHAFSYIRYLQNLETSRQPESLEQRRLFAALVASNLRPDDVLLLETERLQWWALCYYLPENQRVWYAPKGRLGMGLSRLPDSTWGPDRPERILYAVSRSEGSENPGVSANLEFLSRAYELLPPKLESKTWKIFFLKSRRG